jgi:crossover junction endodeoxyribonuclease RuvC
MNWIGIDVGLTGAVAVILESGEIIIFDTPTTVVKSGKKNKTTYLEREMASILEAFSSGSQTFLEGQHSMPEQGVASVFSLGEGFGLWKGILAGLGMSFTIVTPQAWKKALMEGMGKEKGAARVRAQQLFPKITGELHLVKHHGRADAVLIAEYGRRTWQRS